MIMGRGASAKFGEGEVWRQTVADEMTQTDGCRHTPYLSPFKFEHPKRINDVPKSIFCSRSVQWVSKWQGNLTAAWESWKWSCRVLLSSNWNEELLYFYILILPCDHRTAQITRFVWFTHNVKNYIHRITTHAVCKGTENNCIWLLRWSLCIYIM